MTDTTTHGSAAAWRILCLLDNGALRIRADALVSSARATDLDPLRELIRLDYLRVYIGGHRVNQTTALESLDAVGTAAMHVTPTPEGKQALRSPANQVRRYLNLRPGQQVILKSLRVMTRVQYAELMALVEAGHIALVSPETGEELHVSILGQIADAEILVKLTAIGRAYVPTGTSS